MKLRFGAALLISVAGVASANAQNLKVTGAVETVGGVGVTGSVTAGGGSDLSGLGAAMSGPTYSGELPGRVGVKVGDKVIELRSAVGLGNQQNNYRVGAGVPF